MSIELSEQEQLRRQSLAALRELGIDPYPAARYEVTATAREIAENFDETKGNYGDVRIAGRIMTRRIMGSASFFELQDHTGRIQVYIRRDDICPEGDPTLYNTVFKKLLDIGDFIGVEGFAFHTNTGELSVHCRKFTVLSKSIRPLPVVKAKKAIAALAGAGEVEVLVDNEIAVQNLTKMAKQKGCQSAAEKLGEREYRVLLTVGEPVEAEAEAPVCTPDARTDTVVAIASDKMGEGAEELGKTLLKAFVFSLTQQDKLPKTILFYNGGAHLTCAGSPMLDDLKALEAEGVEILTCGTCLNFYGLTEQLAVGGVTNMYVIAEKMLTAGNVVKP